MTLQVRPGQGTSAVLVGLWTGTTSQGDGRVYENDKHSILRPLASAYD